MGLGLGKSFAFAFFIIFILSIDKFLLIIFY